MSQSTDRSRTKNIELVLDSLSIDDDCVSLTPTATATSEECSERCERNMNQHLDSNGRSENDSFLNNPTWDINCYPSGRMPLVPLVNSEMKFMKKEPSTNCKSKGKKKDLNKSWINRAFCSLHTSYEDVDHVVNENNLTYGNNKSKKKIKNRRLQEQVRISRRTPSSEAFAKCDEDEQRQLEHAIENFLGINGNWCNGWQSFLTHDDGISTTSDPDDIRRALRSRVGYLKNSRVDRIMRLQENLDPFDNDKYELSGSSFGLANLKGFDSRSCNRINSFADNMRGMPSSSSTFGEEKQSKQFSVWNSVQTCGVTEVLTREEDKELSCASHENLFYDSDPEDVRAKFRMNKSRESRGRFEERTRITTNNLLIQQRHDIMNAKINLIWHKSSEKSRASSPIAVSAWIELGSQLRSALIQPKFMWRPHHQTGSSCISTEDLHYVDLLDISRILLMSHKDKELYPLAKMSCSIVLQSFDRRIIFQASSELERDWIIYGLKLTISRLGSKIITGDEEVFSEYFTPFQASVPGDVPEFFQE
mmetsp:Transcript_13657/g.19534  ORF Transcript_13657/g.19534 Transcript_13657/m.19534 type:complete len:534 (+) Transcript_13657:353-1954(+)|eukprot:CAMPEP_0184856204 /NCGR_PEP_ID=MMETSP0580-20130426/1361_1 /TAXON_ID=1118495 /ORGANISM="Dactyliosolen fragilissimus" /LENGTH=533 /DNA_ID=CAMNT_0027351063 /DNA_START=282 /DNA_END=1883 /DNA_ORIENTATION=-